VQSAILHEMHRTEKDNLSKNSMPGAFSSGLFLFEVAIPPEY